MPSLRSLFLNTRVAAAREIAERHLPPDTQIQVTTGYALDGTESCKKVRVVKDYPWKKEKPLVDVEVCPWGGGKPVVRYAARSEIDPDGTNRQTAHAIAGELTRRGGYIFPVEVVDPSDLF